MNVQNHKGSGDAVGRDKVLNLSIRFNKTNRFILIITIFAVVLAGFMSYISPKKEVNYVPNTFSSAIFEKSLSKEELENRFQELSDKNVVSERKNEIINEIRNNFAAETTVIVKGNVEVLERPNLDKFLKKLKYGGYDEISIESIKADSIIVRHDK